MLPFIELFHLHISTYVLLQMAAYLAACMFAFHRLYQGGLPHQAAKLALSTAAGAFLGSHLLVWAYQILAGWIGAGLQPGAGPSQAALLAVGGSSSLGGVAGGISGLFLASRRFGLAPGRVFDLVIPAVPLGQAIGRLGCQAAGCCYGRPTESWLGLYLPDDAGAWQARYPTQLLSSALDLAIFAGLLWLDRRFERRGRPFDGLLFVIYLLAFSLKRFLVEFLRADAQRVLGPLTTAHFFAGGFFLLAAGLLLAGLALRRRAEPGELAPQSS
jgi:phosphatidylglycerol:prolipoprotein diacylglycerol transferase